MSSKKHLYSEGQLMFKLNTGKFINYISKINLNYIHRLRKLIIETLTVIVVLLYRRQLLMSTIQIVNVNKTTERLRRARQTVWTPTLQSKALGWKLRDAHSRCTLRATLSVCMRDTLS